MSIMIFHRLLPLHTKVKFYLMCEACSHKIYKLSLILIHVGVCMFHHMWHVYNIQINKYKLKVHGTSNVDSLSELSLQ